jgi:hypothetical protein
MWRFSGYQQIEPKGQKLGMFGQDLQTRQTSFVGPKPDFLLGQNDH